MSKRVVVYHPEALTELLAALDWYDERRAGLGDELEMEVRLVTVALEEHPEAFPAARDSGFGVDLRQARVHRFPYRIVFYEDRSTVHVVAVAHLSRRPGYWRERLHPSS